MRNVTNADSFTEFLLDIIFSQNKIFFWLAISLSHYTGYKHIRMYRSVLYDGGPILYVVKRFCRHRVIIFVICYHFENIGPIF